MFILHVGVQHTKKSMTRTSNILTTRFFAVFDDVLLGVACALSPFFEDAPVPPRDFRRKLSVALLSSINAFRPFFFLLRSLRGVPFCSFSVIRNNSNDYSISFSYSICFNIMFIVD